MTGVEWVYNMHAYKMDLIKDIQVHGINITIELIKMMKRSWVELCSFTVHAWVELRFWSRSRLFQWIFLMPPQLLKHCVVCMLLGTYKDARQCKVSR